MTMSQGDSRWGIRSLNLNEAIVMTECSYVHLVQGDPSHARPRLRGVRVVIEVLVGQHHTGRT